MSVFQTANAILLFTLFSLCQGGDFGWVRGANYIPSNAAWDFFGPGVWNKSLIERELSFAADLRLNALRIRTSPHAFNSSTGAFRTNMASFLTMARTRNLSVMPTLFDTGDLTTFDATTIRSYLGAVTGDGAGRAPPWDAIMGYDACNECYFTAKGSASEAALAEHIAALGNLAAPHGWFVTTGIGTGGHVTTWPRELDQLHMPGLSLVSFHSYNGNQTDFDAGIGRLAQAAASAKLQLGFASEVANRPWDPVCGDLDVLRRRGLGFIFWELMQSQSGWAPPRCAGCPSYQGLLFPNGSAFSEEEVACVKQAALPAKKRIVDWVPVKWGMGSAQPPIFAPEAAWSVVSAGSAVLPWQDRAMRGQLAAFWIAEPINVTGIYDEVNPGTSKIDARGIVVTQRDNLVSASCHCAWQSGEGGVLTGSTIQNMRFSKERISQNGTVAANRTIQWSNGALWLPTTRGQRAPVALPTMTLVFTGVRVTLWYAALPGGATLEVHVDGKSTGQQIHTEAPELEVSASVDVVSGLDGAEHTLLLSVVHGSGSSLSISGFDVWH